MQVCSAVSEPQNSPHNGWGGVIYSTARLTLSVAQYCNTIFPMKKVTKIYAPPTSLHGTDVSTSYPGDSPASHSVSPDEETERMTTATSGRILSASYTRYDPLGLLVRTLLESYRWYSPAGRLRWKATPLYSLRICRTHSSPNTPSSPRPSAKTSKHKDIRSSRFLFRLALSGHHTVGTGCSLLPTVTAIDAGSGRTNRSLSPGATIRPTLALAAKSGMLPTVQTQGLKYCTPEGRTAFIPLNMLPTPTASDWQGPGGHRAGGDNLRTTISRRNPDGPDSLMLNPLFVEDMMGFPSMWTVLPFLGHNGDVNP